MNRLKCLNELDPPYQFYSILQLCNSNSTRFCVLADGYFIVFNDKMDPISVYRVPINKHTRLDFTFDKFTISYSKFSFSFSHQSIDLLSQWKEVLTKEIKSDVIEMEKDSEMEIMKIDKISKSECPVIFCRTSCKLLIYESWEYLTSNICTHVINLKNTAKIEFHDNILSIKTNNNCVYNLEFKSQYLAKKWDECLRGSIENYGDGLCKIYENSANKKCADCGSPNPKCVSLNLCITICDSCIISHRKLGTIVSKPEKAEIITMFPNRCWIVKLVNQIGNDNANGFWNKTKSHCTSSDSLQYFERKYKQKEFADKTLFKLSNDSIIDKLHTSVTNSDVSETMCLWFSYNGHICRSIVNLLLKEAHESGQEVQEQFLLLQENVNEMSENDFDGEISAKAIFAGSLLVSINKRSKSNRCKEVCIYKDSITIMVDEKSEICTIYINFINMVIWNKSEKIVEIFVTDKCSVWKKMSLLSGPTYVTNIIVKETDEQLFERFNESLRRVIIPNNLKPLSEDTTIFFIAEIEINSKQLTIYRCHVTRNELTLEFPDFQNYDLTRSNELKLATDCQSVIVRISNDEILFKLADRSEMVFRHLIDASKVSLMSLYDERTVMKFKILIDFIRDYGLTIEGIFRISGQAKLSNSLFENVYQARIYFLVNRNIYSVHDAVTCLKKCFRSYLDEDLIPSFVYEALVKTINGPEKDSVENTCKSVIAKLFDINYQILRMIVELFYMIVQMTDFNKMDSNNLSISAAQSIFPNIENKMKTNCEILTFLIENFVFLFDYSVDEQRSMLTRINLCKQQVRL